MLGSICAAFVGAVVLFTVLRTSQAPNALRASEEAAHSAEVERRARRMDSRREARHRVERSGTATVLGDAQSKAPCRIVNASRSGLRIASARSFRQGAQVHVQWGDRFFVGTVCHTVAHGDESFCGLQLLTCNYSRPPGAWFRF
ncbi:MAG: PilZ domain-containing protein [Acidobacteriia bacterium]|nr:PilZ domain-containing protein [Terriglobia bacterium]